MQNKKKIVFHLNQIGYGGTEKAILTFLENINREIYEVYVFVSEKRFGLKWLRYLVLSKMGFKNSKKRFKNLFLEGYSRESQFKSLLGDKLILGPTFGSRLMSFLFFGKLDFIKFIEKTKPDIIHLNRGVEEDPIIKAILLIKKKDFELNKIKVVESSIFGKPAPENYLQVVDHFFFVSDWLKDKSELASILNFKKCSTIYNPIRSSIWTIHSKEFNEQKKSFRQKFGIPEGAFVMARIGRPDLFEDEFLPEIYNNLKSKYSNLYLLVLGVSGSWRELGKNDKNIILLPPTSDEFFLDQFYTSIDLFLHRRLEGETFGMTIAEAMIHGAVVISHKSFVDNAQLELLSDEDGRKCGFFTDIDDRQTYQKHIEELITNPHLRIEVGNNAYNKAMKKYEASKITQILVEKYQQLI